VRARKCGYSFERSLVWTPRVLTDTEGNTRETPDGEGREGPPESTAR
jgi:hypothetical protein